MSLCCGSVCGRGVWEGQCCLFCSQWLPVTFPATHKQIGPFWCWFLGGWVSLHSRTCSSLQQTLLWGWEFQLQLQHPGMFSVRGFEAPFSHAVTLGCAVCLTLQLFLSVYSQANVGLPGLPATTLPAPVLQPCLAASALHPSCPSPPLLPVWMNVSSLTPWSSNSQIELPVQFSGSSCYFCF